MDTKFKKGMIPWNKKEHIIKYCKFCGKKFDVKPSLKRVNSCSWSCAAKARLPNFKGKKHSESAKRKMRLAKLGIRGENHWNWKGSSLDNERHLIMQRDEYKTWRRSVFIRDTFTCRDCGKTQVYIEAHHLKSYKDFPDMRFILNNGVTLCSKCHKRRHKISKMEVIPNG